MYAHKCSLFVLLLLVQIYLYKAEIKCKNKCVSLIFNPNQECICDDKYCENLSKLCKNFGTCYDSSKQKLSSFIDKATLIYSEIIKKYETDIVELNNTIIGILIEKDLATISLGNIDSFLVSTEEKLIHNAHKIKQLFEILLRLKEKIQKLQDNNTDKGEDIDLTRIKQLNESISDILNKIKEIDYDDKNRTKISLIKINLDTINNFTTIAEKSFPSTMKHYLNASFRIEDEINLLQNLINKYIAQPVLSRDTEITKIEDSLNDLLVLIVNVLNSFKDTSIIGDVDNLKKRANATRNEALQQLEELKKAQAKEKQLFLLKMELMNEIKVYQRIKHLKIVLQNFTKDMKNVFKLSNNLKELIANYQLKLSQLGQKMNEYNIMYENIKKKIENKIKRLNLILTNAEKTELIYKDIKIDDPNFSLPNVNKEIDKWLNDVEMYNKKFSNFCKNSDIV